MDTDNLLSVLPYIAVIGSGFIYWVGGGIIGTIAAAAVIFNSAFDKGLLSSPPRTTLPIPSKQSPSSLDTQLDTVLKVASYPYAKQFVKNNHIDATGACRQCLGQRTLPRA
jgi:hypothetical protein